MNRLKWYLKSTSIRIGLISLIICAIIFVNNDYLKHTNRECLVLNKMETLVGKGRTDYLLILQDEHGKAFDISVTPTIYSQTNKGDKLTFRLSNMEIEQSFMNNLIFFFGQIVTFAIGFVFIFMGLKNLGVYHDEQ